MPDVRPCRRKSPRPSLPEDRSALDHLSVIRETMERSSTFTAVPGWGFCAMGVTALVAAPIAFRQSSAPAWLAAWLIEAMRHGDNDSFWKDAGSGVVDHLAEFKDVPVYHLTGWYDSWAGNTTANYAALTRQLHSDVYLIMGPWIHGAQGGYAHGQVTFGADAAIADPLGARTRAGDDGHFALEAVVSASCRHGSPRISCFDGRTIVAMASACQRANRNKNAGLHRRSRHLEEFQRAGPNSKARTCIAASAWRSW